MKNSEKMKEHSKHHTKKHMLAMTELIGKGLSFNKAHEFVLKYVGK